MKVVTPEQWDKAYLHALTVARAHEDIRDYASNLANTLEKAKNAELLEYISDDLYNEIMELEG